MTPPLSIRPFIGAQDFDESRRFYQDLGFSETVLSPSLSVFRNASLSFYLQNAYVKDWVDNTMVFLEVVNVDEFWKELTARNLTAKYTTIRLEPVRLQDWGSVCYIHDPSGVLWHVGEFVKTR